jgi:chromosome segregation ATPase
LEWEPPFPCSAERTNQEGRMRAMKMGLALLAGLLVLPAEAGAQATPLPPPNGDSIIQELRLLRAAIERQSRSTARVQLLVGRLTVQDQRVGRAQAAAERLDEEAFTLEQQRRRLDAEMGDLTRAFEKETDAGKKAELDGKLRSARARMSEHTALAAQVESRRSRARQSVAAEQSRYQDVDAKLTELERELETPR